MKKGFLKPMKQAIFNLMKIAAIALLMTPLLCAAQSNVLYDTITDFTLTSRTNISVEMDLISPLNRKGAQGQFISNDPLKTTADTNGNFGFTNVLWGRYGVAIHDSLGTHYTAYVGTNTTGTWLLSSLTTNAAAVPGYPTPNYAVVPFMSGTNTVYRQTNGTNTFDVLTGIGGTNSVNGATGPQGPAATIAVGTVTTGAAGSGVIVTNTGSTNAAVLAFTIPRGDTGAPGINGTNGLPGLSGTNAINWNFSSNFSVTGGTNVDVTNSPHADSATTAASGWPVQWPAASITNAPWLTVVTSNNFSGFLNEGQIYGLGGLALKSSVTSNNFTGLLNYAQIFGTPAIPTTNNLALTNGTYPGMTVGSAITAGTVTDTNIARRNTNNTFTAPQVFTTNVIVGLNLSSNPMSITPGGLIASNINVRHLQGLDNPAGDGQLQISGFDSVSEGGEDGGSVLIRGGHGLNGGDEGIIYMGDTNRAYISLDVNNYLLDLMSQLGVIYGWTDNGGNIYVTGASAAFAGGYASGAGAVIYSDGDGAFAQGKALNGGVIYGDSDGAFVQGKADGTNSLISGDGDGAFAQGKALNGGVIHNDGDGAFAQGKALNGGVIYGDGDGAFAQGKALNGGVIHGSGDGAFAQGRADGTNSLLLASGDGSHVLGKAVNGGVLEADNDGSFVGGLADGTTNKDSEPGQLVWVGDILVKGILTETNISQLQSITVSNAAINNVTYYPHDVAGTLTWTTTP